MNKTLKSTIWILIAIIGASAVGSIALNRGENINALWFIAAAICVYSLHIVSTQLGLLPVF